MGNDIIEDGGPYREAAAGEKPLAPGQTFEVWKKQVIGSYNIYSLPLSDLRRHMNGTYGPTEITAIMSSDGKPWADNERVFVCKTVEDIARASAFCRARFHLDSSDLNSLGLVDPATF
jgi:hypothetical protein